MNILVRRTFLTIKPRVFYRSMTTKFTAACCIIGDEILNGKTRDSNAYFLAKYLFDIGVDLKRVETIADDYDAIAETIRRLSNQHDVVFTSGGIGPTHDDITYSALAKAYDLPLKLDTGTCNMMEEMSKDKYPNWTLTEARKRMALFPDPCEILHESKDLWVPVVVVNKNIHVLPGIPRLFEGLLDSLKPHFKKLVFEKLGSDHGGELSQYHRVQVGTALGEGDIADFLGEVQNRVNEQDIKIGSYPNWNTGHDGARVVVSVVGKDEKLVKSIGDEIVKGIQGWITAGKRGYLSTTCT